jgi:hypothetical protein
VFHRIAERGLVLELKRLVYLQFDLNRIKTCISLLDLFLLAHILTNCGKMFKIESATTTLVAEFQTSLLLAFYQGSFCNFYFIFGGKNP